MSVGGDVDWVGIQRAFQHWVVAGSGLDAQHVVWGQQDAPRPEAPAIVMRISNQAEIGQTWNDTVPNPLVLAPLTITSVSGNVLTSVAHGLLTGDGPFQLTTTGTLPTGLALATDYWVIVLSANTFELATSYVNTGGGQGAGNPTTPITLTGAGTGTTTMSTTASSLRAGQEVVTVARGLERVTLELKCHAGPVGLGMATAILQRVRRRRTWPSQQALVQAVNVGLIGVERVRAVQGTRDGLLFEPRAYLDVHFCVVDEESDVVPGTIIATAQVTDLLTNTETDVPIP